MPMHLSLYEEAFRYNMPERIDVFNDLSMAYCAAETASVITYCNNLASHSVTRDAFLS